jgi:hypothetical protein
MPRLMLPDGTRAHLDGPLDPAVPLVVLLHGFGGGIGSMTAPRRALPGWRDSLLAAGFSTLSYAQVAPTGTLEPNIEQLLAIAAGPLSRHPRLRRLTLAIVAHSRGGLLARAFLDRASGLPGLAGLRPAALAAMRSFSASPGVAELAPGSPVLRALEGRPAIPGITWHTFGGTSADLARLRAVLGADNRPATGESASARLARTRGLTEVLAILDRLALLSPALRDGEGDVVVADACTRLPFAASHTTNRLTHIEALWDPALHAQVVDLLRGTVGERGLSAA